MRIFHFVNASLGIDQLSSGGKDITGGGGWTAALLGRMLEETDFNFAYAAFGQTNDVQHTHNDRIDYFVIPKLPSDGRRQLERGLEVCRNLVESWKPDLIHVHGTEGPFGLLSARGMIGCPLLISLQGLLGPSSEWYRFFGKQSLRDIIRMHRWDEIVTMRGLWKGFRQIRDNAKREMEIINGNRFFMGRTEWDQTYIRTLNPQATYYHEGRLLREPFWHKRWNINHVERHRVIFTNARHPRKGTELLMEAAGFLKTDYPDIRVCIAGGIPLRSGYGKYLRRQLGEYGDIPILLGALNAEQMADELLKSHVFVSPSYIDNSPNAISEAQLVGMPVISTYTGGIPTLIDDAVTGLFCPVGDAPMLAAKLRQVFESDELAVRLGDQAHSMAINRHNPRAIVSELLAIYQDILTR